jgi:TonB family protein
MFFEQRGQRRFVWRSAIGVFVLALALALCARAEDRAVKSRVAPVYPEIAKRMKIVGVVRLEVTVDPEGKVVDVKPVSGNRSLSEAAEEAVRKWKFVPGPSLATVNVDLNFELAQ